MSPTLLPISAFRRAAMTERADVPAAPAQWSHGLPALGRSAPPAEWAGQGHPAGAAEDMMRAGRNPCWACDANGREITPATATVVRWRTKLLKIGDLGCTPFPTAPEPALMVAAQSGVGLWRFWVLFARRWM